METIEMEVPFDIPKGYEVESFDVNSNKLKLKKKPLSFKERIYSIEDVFRDHNISDEEAESKRETLTDIGLEHMYYQWIAELIVKSANGDWSPDWGNSNEYKYYPWFEMKGSSGFLFDDCARWRTRSNVGSRLCFRSREDCEHAGTTFCQSVYEKFMTIK